MALSRDIYAEKSHLVPMEFLQSLFVAELICPSSQMWISSPWVNDVNLIDNTARQFGSLVPAWPTTMIRLSSVLGALIERGVKITAIVNYDVQNNEFVDRLQRMKDELLTDDLRIIRTRDVHEKGIVSDHFTIDGSMNFTFRGIHINQEYLGYRCDPELVFQRRLVLEERWGER